MADITLIEAIKSGLKGELDSITIYSEAAMKADGEVQRFFLERAGEEKRHHDWLLSYWKELEGGATPARNLAAEAAAQSARSPILTEDFLKRVGESQALSTAVAAATLLEANAIRHYADAAEKAPAGALRSFLESLSKWESRHYEELIRIQDESRRYWFDAHHFEPF
ncbi:MAG: hypothetical protein KBC36_06345 [Spirochaetia bacterium]|nr:hypothetical protein [Spirochaetia bacterium]